MHAAETLGATMIVQLYVFISWYRLLSPSSALVLLTSAMHKPWWAVMYRARRGL